MLRPSLPSRGRVGNPADGSANKAVIKDPTTLKNSIMPTLRPTSSSNPTPTSPMTPNTKTMSILRPQTITLEASTKRAVIAPYVEEPQRDTKTPRLTPGLRRSLSYSELPSPAVSRSQSPYEPSRTPSAEPRVARTPSVGSASPTRAMTPTLGSARIETARTLSTRSASTPRPDYSRAISPGPGPIYTNMSVTPSNRSGSAPSRMMPRLYSERSAITPVDLDRIRAELERDMQKELDKIRTAKPVTDTPKLAHSEGSVKSGLSLPLPEPRMQILVPNKSNLSRGGRVMPGQTPEIYRTPVVSVPPSVNNVVKQPPAMPVVESHPVSSIAPASTSVPSYTPTPTPTPSRAPTSTSTSTPTPVRTPKLQPSTQVVRKEMRSTASLPVSVSLPPVVIAPIQVKKPKLKAKATPSAPIMEASEMLPDPDPLYDDYDFPDVPFVKPATPKSALKVKTTELRTTNTEACEPDLRTPLDDKIPSGIAVILSEEELAEALKLYMRVNVEDYGILHSGDVISYINEKGALVKEVILKRMYTSKKNGYPLWCIEIFHSHRYRKQYTARADKIQQVWKRVGLESASLARGVDLIMEDMKDIQAFLEYKFGKEFTQFMKQREARKAPRFRPGDILTPQFEKPRSSAF